MSNHTTYVAQISDRGCSSTIWTERANQVSAIDLMLNLATNYVLPESGLYLVATPIPDNDSVNANLFMATRKAPGAWEIKSFRPDQLGSHDVSRWPPRKRHSSSPL